VLDYVDKPEVAPVLEHRLTALGDLAEVVD
jgi:hypothetical protein